MKKNRNTFKRRLFALVACVVVVVCACVVPCSAITSSMFNQKTVNFHPTFIVNEEGTSNPDDKLKFDIVSGFDNLVATDWKTAQESLMCTTGLMGEDSVEFDWHLKRTHKITKDDRKYTLVDRSVITNSVLNDNLYKITVCQDLIYLPFEITMTDKSAINNPYIEAWTTYKIKLQSLNTTNVEIVDMKADFDIYAFDFDVTTTTNGDSVKGVERKLLSVSHSKTDLTAGVYTPFTSPVYMDTISSMNAKCGSKGSWVAIKNFSVSYIVRVSGSTPTNTKLYIDTYQPLRVLYTESERDLYDFDESQYFTKGSVIADYAPPIGGGTTGSGGISSSSHPSGIGWLVDTVDDFFSIELFFDLSFGDILWFSIAVGLLFFLLKACTG